MFQQSGIILVLHFVRRRSLAPFRDNFRPGQQSLRLLEFGWHHDQRRNALAPGAPGTTRPVQQHFGIRRQVGVDHQLATRQVNAACRHIGGNADPCAPVTQGLQGVRALLLRQFAGQGDHLKPAIAHARHQMVHIGAGLAEHDGGLGFVKPQHVENRMLTVAQRHRKRAVFDIDVLTRFACRLNAQSIALKFLGKRGDFFRHRRGKHQRATLGWRGLQDKLQILAEPQIEHLVCFVQHRGTQARQVQRAAFDMVTQPSRRSDHDMRATIQRAFFRAVIHATDTGSNFGRGAFEQPVELPRHLQRQFPRWGDDQGQRAVGVQKLIRAAQQFVGYGDAKGHRLAGSGLRRNQKVTPGHAFAEHGVLHRRQGFVTLRRQSRSQRGCDTDITHVFS